MMPTCWISCRPPATSMTLDGSVRTGRLAAPDGWDRQIR
jgi:hypothetical protein